MAVEQVDQLVVAEQFQLIEPMLGDEDVPLHASGLFRGPVFEQLEVVGHQEIPA